MKTSAEEIPDVLEKIAGLPDSALYGFAGPGQGSVRRGWSYFFQNRLFSFLWEDSWRLKAVVLGSKPYQVRITFEEAGNFAPSCDCPVWSPEYQCKHAACMLLTIRHISQTPYRELTGHCRMLAQQLFNVPAAVLRPEPAVGSVVSSASSKMMQIHVKNDFENSIDLEFRISNVVLNASSNKIPKLFRKFLRDQWTHGFNVHEDSAEEMLCKFLDAPDREFEMWIHTGRGPVVAKWQRERSVTLRLQLDRRGDAVEVKRLAFSESGEKILFFARIGQSLFLDISDGILSRSDNWRSWTHANFLEKRKNRRELARWNGGGEDFDDDRIEEEDEEDLEFAGSFEEKIKSFTVDSNPFKVTAAEFNQWPIVLLPGDDYSRFLQEEVFFLIDGNPVQISEESCALRLSLLKSEDPYKMKLALEGRLGDFLFSFQNHPLLQKFQLQWKNNDFELPCFSQRDKNRLREAMAHLVLQAETGDGKMSEKIIRETEKEFRDISVRHAARHCLRDFARYLKDAGEALQFHTDSGRWILGKIPKRLLLAVVGLSFLFLGKEVAGLCEINGAFVSKRKVLESLMLLKKELAARGAELYFDQKAVRVSRLDFVIDATRKSEEDWFEIHPEIKLDQKLLSRTEWDSLGRDGFLVMDGVIQVVDANSSQLLSKLNRFLNSREPSSKTHEYVRVPSLEIFDWLALKKLNIEVKLSPEDEAMVNRLLRFSKLPAYQLPCDFQGTLREYQKEGYDWLAFLYAHNFGACLADDMGLGKTVQAIAFLAGLKEGQIKAAEATRHLPHLIVMPSSLVFNWESEIKRFYPNFKMTLYVGQGRSCDFEGVDIVLTTYDLLRRDIDKIKDKAFHVILFDEAQMIKNLFSARASAVRTLKGRFKMAMTGTPFENHLGEYYSVMDLCLPGLFGEYNHFRAQVKDDDFGFITHRTRPFVLRRTKDKILKELPPKVESDIYLSLTVSQKALYQKTVEEVKGDIEKAYQEKTEAQARIMALTGMLRLRQICVSPALVRPEIKQDCPKMEYLISKIHELENEGHAALVFSQFTSFLDILEHGLKKEKIRFCRLDGQTPLLKRRGQVEFFQTKDGPPVFLISIKAGGFGLNLTRANYVFHLDPWWNPAVDRQASDRAHRIGQEKTVLVQRILMRHTIEEKVMALRNSKWELFQAVMNDDSVGGFKGTSLSHSDFEFLLS